MMFVMWRGWNGTSGRAERGESGQDPGERRPRISDHAGEWFRSHGNEQWEFDATGLMQRREASINDVAIKEAQRRLLWAAGARPPDHGGLSDLRL